MAKKLSNAQAFIIDTLSENPESKLIRDEFIVTSYYILNSDLSRTKVMKATVQALHYMNLITMGERDNKLRREYKLVYPVVSL